MDYCQMNSCPNFAWQATLEGILSNLHGEFLIASSKNAIGHLPVPKQLTTEAVFMLYIILTFVILAIIGSSVSAIELFCKQIGREISALIVKGKPSKAAAYINVKERSCESAADTDVWKNCKKYLECFSVQNNTRKLLSTASGEEHLNSLHGIKTVALIWVMINHIAMFYATILRTVSDEFQSVLEMPLSQFVVNGIFSNDIFFVLSGFVNSYMFFDFYKKRNGKIPWLLFYVSRFLRFTPLYLIVMGFYSTLFSYIDSGPAWPTYQTNPICKENWIWNVLYLNNFLPHKRQCILTTWYIACDLQLYVISPIFLLLLMRRPKIGHALIVACIFGSCLISFMLTNHFNLIDGASKLALYSRNMKHFYGRFWVYFDMIYVKPYTRIGTYVVGIALGYIVFQRKLSGFKKNNLVTLCIGGTLSLIFFCTAIFAIYNREESDLERALYNGVKHVFSSCSIAWVIYICVSGQGGLVNWIFSRPIFVPISRISYCFYFIHIITIEKYFLSIDELIEYTPASIVWVHLQIMMWSLAVSFVVSLIFERPLLNLISLLMKETKPEKKVQ